MVNIQQKTARFGLFFIKMVEVRGFEPLASALRTRRSTN